VHHQRQRDAEPAELLRQTETQAEIELLGGAAAELVAEKLTAVGARAPHQRLGALVLRDALIAAAGDGGERDRRGAQDGRLAGGPAHPPRVPETALVCRER